MTVGPGKLRWRKIRSCRCSSAGEQVTFVRRIRGRNQARNALQIALLGYRQHHIHDQKYSDKTPPMSLRTTDSPLMGSFPRSSPKSRPCAPHASVIMMAHPEQPSSHRCYTCLSFGRAQAWLGDGLTAERSTFDERPLLRMLENGSRFLASGTSDSKTTDGRCNEHISLG